MSSLKKRNSKPINIRGSLPVKAVISPWWESVKDFLSSGEFIGKVFTIEEIAALVPKYPDGRSVRPRAASRRLKPILELISRGPNGSLGKGATYKIIGKPVKVEVKMNSAETNVILSDDEYIQASIARIIGEKKK